MTELIICCSCKQEKEDHSHICSVCGDNFCHDCDETCLDCDNAFCKSCFDKSKGAFIDRCNDCYLRQYGTGDEPDYPDDYTNVK